MPELLFHGAAGEVTGSMHMISVEGRWLALDCGLFQGRREESEAKNRQWPMPPEKISAVVLSHAHIDHCGRLPRLVRDGFQGEIYATPATRDLCALMLADSAHIQEEDVYYVSKRRKKAGLPPIEPLYEYRDALAAMDRMISIPGQHWFQPLPGVIARFHEAGHMLGAGGVELAFGKREGASPSLYFSGDVGRPNKPILRDPEPFPAVDTLICESTYGGRRHETVDDAKTEFLRIVKETVARGGKVIVPAFSVGRTQTLVFYLHQEMLSGGMHRIPIFVDSPLAANATDVFRLHPECFDAEARALHAVTGDILGGGCCTYVRHVDDSKALHRRKGPMVIIAGSGMCEAGRIRHHLKNNLGDSVNTVLLPGFQAMNTLGRKLADGAKVVRLFQEDWPVRAEVRQLHGFSGHADQEELLALISPIRRELKRTWLVHGEPERSSALREEMTREGYADVRAASRGEQATI